MNLSMLTNFLALDVGAAFEDALNSLILNINIAIYNLINFLYNLFENLAVAEFLDNSIIEGVYQRVGLILGLLMIFKLTFSLIQTMINPSDEKIKGSTKLITKMVIVIVLLGTVNTIFDEARRLQENVLVNDNIISKVILGRDNDPEDDFGMVLASETFFTFYTDTEAPYFNGPGYNPDDKDYFNELVTEDCDGDGDPSNDNNCMVKFKNLVINEQDLNLTKYLINSRSQDEGWFNAGLYYVEFNGFICLAVGIFMLYILLSYCLAVGVRTIQLAFLQLIAPIPIISYIDPKDDTAFSKWLKLCITTYVDVFIRVAIIYFIVFMIKGVMESDIDYLLASSTDGTSLLWIKIVLFLALLMFAKKAPDLIHDLFPKATGSIGFGLSLKEKFKNMSGAGIVAGAVGAAGAAALGGTASAIANIANERRNFAQNWSGWSGKERLKNILRGTGSALGGLGSGFARGAYSGYKNGIKGGPLGIGKAGMGAATASSKARNARDQGYNMRDRVYDYATDVAGLSKQMGTTSEIKDRIKGLREQMANFQRDEQNHSEALRTIATANDGAKYADYYKAFERKLRVDNDGRPILDANKNFQYDYNYSSYSDFIAANPTSTLTQQEYDQYGATMAYRDYADNEARKLNAQINKLEEATSKEKKQ